VWPRAPAINTYGPHARALDNESVQSDITAEGYSIVTIPVQITFRHMETSAALETRVRELAGHLGVFSDRIQNCRVVVDSPHRHHHQGKVFNVKVQLALPGEDVVVDMERPDRDGHEDVYVVLRDAFDAAKRQLQQRMSSLRGETGLREKPVA
jgi:Sigma 54 modulation protein / S30EA ribosomal protein.